jgi:hypothetical protein
MAEQEAKSPLVFRPDKTLRIVVCVFAALCVWGAIYQAVLLHVAAAIVLALPCILAATLLKRRIEVRDDAFVSVGLLKTREIPWAGVRRIDQTRRSFVFVTDKGSVSAGWIAAGQRDLLFRKVLEKAKLTISPEKTRWGILAQYVPRAQPIRFTVPADRSTKN